MSDEEKLEFIRTAIIRLFNKDISITPTDDLSALGLDSLDIVELQMYYEDVTGNNTDPDRMIRTVNDLISLMK